MRENVKIHHPATGSEASVDPRSVASWQTSGWVVADEATPGPGSRYLALARSKTEVTRWAREHKIRTTDVVAATTPDALRGLPSLETFEVVELPGFEANPHKDELREQIDVLRAMTPAISPATPDTAAAGSSSTEE